jgi:5-methyltetrahydrofolate--homocysteine methyltransferase
MNDQLKQAIIDGNEGVATAMTQALVATGASAREILDEALLPGMEVVGTRMREGDCFIPEVLLSARVMQACLDVLRPHMAAGDEAGGGVVVIGTVEGDLHDIGKNLVGMLLQGAGFEVVNLGTGVSAADFVAAVREHAPKIVGMSALLTTTLPHMSETIALLKDEGLRDAVKVMVGGAPVTAAYAEEIGADGYGANAGMAVERAKELVAQ